jgi:exonuclease VII small subunit
MANAPFLLHEKIKQLEEIEHYFQRSDMDLEKAIEKHKEALKISKEILEYLEKAEHALKQIEVTDLRGGE